MTADITNVDTIRDADTEPGTTRRFWLRITRDAIGEWRRVPLIVRRGLEPGPRVVLTAVLHGNELNGMRTIQELLAADGGVPLARGTVLAVPVVNLSGYKRHQREFADGKDLNRFFTDDDDGRPAQRFAHTFAEKLCEGCDYLLDLHTAGGGKRNIFYARVDVDDAASMQVARWVAPPLIAHKPPRDNALRGFAVRRGIPSVVLEIGDPGRFQPALVSRSVEGIQRVLSELGMTATTTPPAGATVICRDTYWVRAAEGGTMSLSVRLGDRVATGERVGVIRNVWGDVCQELHAGVGGVVVGLLRRPMVMDGSPTVHIGVPAG